LLRGGSLKKTEVNYYLKNVERNEIKIGYIYWLHINVTPRVKVDKYLAKIDDFDIS